jgi:FO synthase subunit 2
VGRPPVERTPDYRQQRPIDPEDPPFGPELGPVADGTPMVDAEPTTDAPDPSAADD